MCAADLSDLYGGAVAVQPVAPDVEGSQGHVVGPGKVEDVQGELAKVVAGEDEARVGHDVVHDRLV